MAKKKRSKNRLHAAVIFITILLISVTVTIYIRQLRSVLTNSIRTTMQELLLHDTQVILTNMENSWHDLEQIAARLESQDEISVTELLYYLSDEQALSDFELLYFIDENGLSYSNYCLVSDDSELPYVQRILNGEMQFALHYCGDAREYTIMQRDRIVYGVSVAPLKVGDITITGLIGMKDIRSMEDKLTVDSFDGRGYTGLIDRDGYFIINIDRARSLGTQDNIFDMLSSGEISGGANLDDIREGILSEDFCSLSFTDDKGVKRELVSLPIPHSEWIMLLTVERSVFNEQNFEFTMMLSILLIVVLGILGLMLLILRRSMLSAARAQVESKAREDFLSSMSHEIRTPLNGLIGLIHLMRQHRENPQKLESYLEKSSATANYLLTLVNDILDMQKLSQHKMTLTPEPFSLHQTVDMLDAMMRSRMEAAQIRFTIDEELIQPVILGDRGRVEQILINILGNAIKFTPANGEVRMMVRQTLTDSQNVITSFSVSDTGCGMKEDFLDKIFDSFTQEGKQTSDGTKGTGLGMAISQQLAQLMNGTIQVKSRLNEGSTFTFTFPAPGAVLPQESLLQEESGSLHPLTLLVAEDNDLNAEILTEILTPMGYIVHRARNGQEAVELFAASAPGEYDVILMDVQMPVMDGYTAARTIRSLHHPDAASISIFACTANTFKEDRDRALESGMDNFITKPIDIKELLAKLSSPSLQTR